jgi:hypothetical protein
MKYVDKKEVEFALKILNKKSLKKMKQMIKDKTGKRKWKDALEDAQREIAVMKKLLH